MSLYRYRAISILAVGVLFTSALGILAFSGGVAPAAPSTWSIVKSPNPSKSQSSFADVSCASATFCVAVGLEAGKGKKTLVEMWNGSKWSVMPSQNPGKGNILEGVSCSGTMSCVAVGSTWEYSFDSTSTLVESWDGTSWTVVPSPDVASGNGLRDVSCTSPTFCVAVGTDENTPTTTQTLVEAWDGSSWTVTPSPNASGFDNLDRISCTSPTNCVAVGSYSGQTLVETWDGTNWTITPSPNNGTNGSVLIGVSCPSASFCVAVGVGDGDGTLTETWDGTSWMVVPSPSPGKERNILDAVSCTSTTNCVSTGYLQNKAKLAVQTLVESWDGTNWSVTPSATRTTSSELNGGVSCADSMNCVAVGESIPSDGVTRTLALDGSSS
jgi:hypothetical protein